MKDLDKIKELIATCDSQNIELAIAIGVNMEGYERWILHCLMCEGLIIIIKNNHMQYCLSGNKGVSQLPVVYGVKIVFKKLATLSAYEITDNFVRDSIDAYLSL